MNGRNTSDLMLRRDLSDELVIGEALISLN